MYGFIYITTNNINGKKYIGQKKYDKRGYWKNYLGSGTAIKSAINKYGKQNFTKQIIEECESKDVLNEREKYWIGYYNAYNSKDFYNMTFGGDGGDTYSNHNLYEKEQIKSRKMNSTKHKINLGAYNGMAKKVICLNNMMVFNTLSDAGKYANVTPECISNAIKHLNSHNAGKEPVTQERLQWDWYEDDKQYIFKPYKRKYKTGFTAHNALKVKCIELDITFNSITDASKYINRSPASLSEVLRNGKNSKCSNMHWEYV